MGIAARLASALVVFALAGSAAMASQTNKCPPGAPTNWARVPSSDDLAEYYPTRTDGPLVGYATLACIVNDAGLLTWCKVMNETPPSSGFGAAALKLSKFFRVQRPGCPLARHAVQVPIRFEPAPP